MKADKRFLRQPKHFWANVRSISQHIGYTERGTGRIKVPTLAEIADALDDLSLVHSHVLRNNGEPTAFGLNLLAYFEYRAEILNEIVRPSLMNATKARRLFMRLKRTLRPRCPLPMNKQKERMKSTTLLWMNRSLILELKDVTRLS